jgi:hypothetical protein
MEEKGMRVENKSRGIKMYEMEEGIRGGWERASAWFIFNLSIIGNVVIVHRLIFSCFTGYSVTDFGLQSSEMHA